MIIRKLETLGRIAIPARLRRNLKINVNDSLEIFIDQDKIVLKKYLPTCVFCDNVDDVQVYHDKKVCRECAVAMYRINEVEAV